MKKGLKVLLIIALIAIPIALFFVNRYNKMVDLSQQVENQWANVETQYQRRADLIPNFVSTVKGYASHEKETLEGVIEARSKAMQTTISFDQINDQTLAQFQQAQSGLQGALGKLIALSESYPDLKANTSFTALQDELAGTENRIAVSRQDFNKSATEYNTYIKKFPANIVAGMFGFDSKALFAADPAAAQAPKVEF